MTEIEIFGPPGVEKKGGKDKTCEKFGDLNVENQSYLVTHVMQFNPNHSTAIHVLAF
jgi:hypothetical protein